MTNDTYKNTKNSSSSSSKWHYTHNNKYLFQLLTLDLYGIKLIVGTVPIAQFIIDSKCLITAIIETWLTDNDSALSSQLTPRGYYVILTNRSTPSCGGGLALVYSSNLKLVFSTIPSVSSCEMLICHLRCSSYTIQIVLFDLTSSSITAFYDDLMYIFESKSSDNTIILGDFNIQYNSSNTPASSLKCLLYEFSLPQHIHFPTNTNGNCINLVISPSSSKLVSSPFKISDHFAVIFELLLPTFAIPRPVSSLRKISAINITSFVRSVCSQLDIHQCHLLPDSHFDNFNSTVSNSLYLHLSLNLPIDHIPNILGLVMS